MVSNKKPVHLVRAKRSALGLPAWHTWCMPTLGAKRGCSIAGRVLPPLLPGIMHAAEALSWTSAVKSDSKLLKLAIVITTEAGTDLFHIDGSLFNLSVTLRREYVALILFVCSARPLLKSFGSYIAAIHQTLGQSPSRLVCEYSLLPGRALGTVVAWCWHSP